MKRSNAWITGVVVVVGILALLCGGGAVLFGVRQASQEMAMAEQSAEEAARSHQHLQEHALALADCDRLGRLIASAEIDQDFRTAEELWSFLLERGLLESLDDARDPWGAPYLVNRDEDGNRVVWSRGPGGTPLTRDDVGADALK